VLRAPLLQSEVEETVKKLGAHPGFLGYLIINADGIPIRRCVHSRARMCLVSCVVTVRAACGMHTRHVYGVCVGLGQPRESNLSRVRPARLCSSLDHAEAVQYAGLICTLCSKARSAVRELDPSNDITFLRLRSHKHEILVAPGFRVSTNKSGTSCNGNHDAKSFVRTCVRRT
jgi:hypothetical protein